jgi:hypothetical protein
MRAFYNAILLLEALEKEMNNDDGGDGSLSKEQLIQNVYTTMKNEFDLFYQSIQENGWKTHLFLLGTSSLRVTLNTSSDRSTF